MLTPDELIAAGHALDVRPGQPELDVIDGATPDLVIEPRTPEAVAAALAWASARRLSVVIQGAGTKREWGRCPDRLDVMLGMGRLARVLDHRQGDLTVTVEAGLPLRELNETLARHRQQLPLDPPAADRATIGGLLATNDSGPARHRFGTPRDLVIGIQLATPDGLLAKSGGQVVKNVAGYDLGKLICGSFGTLAAIVSATFKVSPLPASSSTLAIDAGGAERLAQVAAAIAASQLEPLAFEFHARRHAAASEDVTSCLIRFASLPAAVEEQVSDAAARVTALGAPSEVLSGEAEARLWRTHLAHASGGAAAIVRASWLPADLHRVLTLIESPAPAIRLDMIGRVGVGAGLIRIDGEIGQQAAVIERLRGSKAVGHVVVVKAATELKRLVDVWGPTGHGPLFDPVKRAFDPNGTLGAGRAWW